MMPRWLRKFIPSKNERELRRMAPRVAAINALEPRMRALSDESMRARVAELRQVFAQAYRAQGCDPDLRITPLLDGDEKKASRAKANAALDPILHETFALVREASRRALEMRHFDVQLMGGMALHNGKIAEMKTGEGKTLVATLPLVLNALAGRGASLVTVNEYLAARDADWMGRIYRFLGLNVGVILHGLTDRQRQEAYGADITYGTNSEFGFDYLRDNMKFRLEDYVQRGHHFAIVDEVDSILIDEARTPLIISGPAEESTDKYVRVNSLIPGLKKEVDYTIDEKARTSMLTEQGISTVEKRLGVDNLYDPANIEILHHVNQALRAHTLFKRDVDYMVEDSKVKIIDEHTGRILEGRRWSDGLHQAVEAKEGVTIENENQTLATVTYQNYFRMYEKLAGMTGTALTEAEEFAKIYDLDVMEIPTNRIMIRKDWDDVILGTEAEKFKTIIDEILDCHQRGQPTLVGTISVEKSEVLARMLKRLKVPHSVLNAKYHKQEAEIIAQAGRKGAVTISTNMAGRGTDIILGGNPEFLARGEVGLDEGADPGAYAKRFEQALAKYRAQCAAEKQEVLAAGGLHILGTERHESRRIDNQLRGRAGRQGDPGSSRFYLSLEDDLMRIFGGERFKNWMQTMGMKEGEVIEHRWVSSSVERAQKSVEGHNFDIRKHLLEYDDVMNRQRRTIYALRRRCLGADDATTRELMFDLIEDVVIRMLDTVAPGRAHAEDWDLDALTELIKDQFNFVPQLDLRAVNDRADLERLLYEAIEAVYLQREQQYSPQAMHHVERIIYLQTIDALWKDHLQNMDQLKEGISLRGYAQKDPKQEYIREGRNMFVGMMEAIAGDVLSKVFRVQFTVESQEEYERRVQEARERQRRLQRLAAGGGPSAFKGGKPEAAVTVRRERPKLGRNDPCHCGSGKKYKHCHLAQDEAEAARAVQ